MKILVITQYFPPEIGAAATRWSEYSAILQNMGHEVTVLCEIPNYPTGIIAKGYSQFKVAYETMDSGVKVVRVPVWASSRQTTVQRLGFFITFMISAMIKALVMPRFDIAIVSSPPLFVGMVGVVLKVFKKSKRIILDIRDLWPESAIVLGEINSEAVLKTGRWMERQVYNSADGFFFAVPGFKDYFKREFSVHSSKPSYPLMNGVSRNFIELLDASTQIHKSQKFTALYSGNVGLAQDLETVLNAAKLMENENVLIQIIGEGARKSALIKMSKDLNLKNVEFISSIPRVDLIKYIQKAHICLVPLMKSDLFLNAIPSKMLEYMAGKKPVVVGIKGEVETLLETSQGGVSIEPGNVKALSDAILHYRDNPEKVESDGTSGANYIKANYIKETLMQRAFQHVIEDEQ